jgi:hypothetical protein
MVGKQRIINPGYFMKPLTAALASLLFVVSVDAQKIKTAEVVYTYNSLPLQPLDKSIRHYTARIEAVYEEKNKQLMADYEAAKKKAEQKFQQELHDYPSLVKAAEEAYEKDLAEYNKKSLGTKVVEKTVLGENNKPVKQLPSKPYLEHVSLPVLKTSYDYPVLANTYFYLGGYENNPDNAVQVIITMYGFDYSSPRVLSQQKDMMSIKSGSSTTYKATYYHTEFSYRHPMSVKVVLPNGKELMNVTPQPLNTYKIYRSPASETMPQVNSELMIKTNEEKVLQENLKFITALVNDKFGNGKKERKGELYYVKEKGDEYADLITAFNDASSGFNLLDKDPVTATAKLRQAVATWQTALKESNPSDKKARIDKDVTIAVCFNLLEAFLGLGEPVPALSVLQQMNSLSLSGGERKTRDEFELIFTDLKKRKEINP